jgi:secondary thiamine-phosphate synthase enzyme
MVGNMQTISVPTRGRTDFVNITSQVAGAVAEEGIEDGVATVFVPHTTCGISLQENADPDVMRDMETVLDRIVPWSGNYAHCEGNTAAHVKASLMGSSVQIIVEAGRLQLGTWQGIYLCEFDGARSRKVWIKG